MRYSEIVYDFPRPWDRDRYPSVAFVVVPAEQFSDVERLIGDQTQTAVLGHELADHDQVLIYVACTCNAVKKRVESRWNV